MNKIFYVSSLSLLLLLCIYNNDAKSSIGMPDWVKFFKVSEPRLYTIFRDEFDDSVRRRADSSSGPTTWGESEVLREQRLNYDRCPEERQYLERTLVDAYSKEPVDWAIVAGVLHCLRIPDLNDTVLSIAEGILSSVKEFSDKELYVVEEAIHVLAMTPDHERLMLLEQYLEPSALGLADDFEITGHRRSMLAYEILFRLSVSTLSIEEKCALFHNLHEKYSPYNVQEPSRTEEAPHPLWYTPKPTISRYNRHYSQILRYAKDNAEFFCAFSPDELLPKRDGIIAP